VTLRSDIVLRAGPGTEFSEIAHVPGGTELETTDCAGGWCQVEFNGIAGFVDVADFESDTAAIRRSLSARRAKNRQRGPTRVTRRPAPTGSAPRSAPGGEDADLFVLPAQAPAMPAKKSALRLVWLPLWLAAVLLAVMTRKAHGCPSPRQADGSSR
jgi:hypothetical protein